MIRLVTSVFDRSYINAEERELYKNIKTLRESVTLLLKKRKSDLKNGLSHGGDFLSILIEDELFAKDEESMLDECCMFLIASTQTTATLLTETLFRITQNKGVHKKIREEIV